jgi:hypothetical protein
LLIASDFRSLVTKAQLIREVRDAQTTETGQ